jgi:hypothetical protein
MNGNGEREFAEIFDELKEKEKMLLACLIGFICDCNSLLK